ncbi:TRAP transporter small permease [Pacificispira sp.]|uniref:TRAP transporter small permease n=1 Tax=Pacificispira sp. TaxID=2888761 RepID=UPI003BAB25AA
MIDRFVTALAWLAAALFTISGCMLTYEVVARYFFVKPTVWAAELSQLCLIWGSLIAMAWALRFHRHIVVDALAAQLPPRILRWTDTGAMVVVAVFSAALVWKGWPIFWDSFERGRTTGSMLDLPAWVAELAVPFGFAVLFAQAVIEAIETFRGNRPGHWEAPHE